MRGAATGNRSGVPDPSLTLRMTMDAQDDNALSSDPSLRLAAEFRMTKIGFVYGDRAQTAYGMTENRLRTG